MRPKQRVPAPGAGELVGALLGDQELAAQRRGDLAPGARPPSRSGRTTGSSRRPAAARAARRSAGPRRAAPRPPSRPCAIRIGVVARCPRTSVAARVFIVEHRGLEADAAAHVEALQVGERRDVARARPRGSTSCTNSGTRDLERGVDLVGGLVLRASRRACARGRGSSSSRRTRRPRSAGTSMLARGTPRRSAGRCGARWLGRAGVELRDEGVGRASRSTSAAPAAPAARRPPRRAARRRLRRVAGASRAAPPRGRASRSGRDGSGGCPVEADDAALVGHRPPVAEHLHREVPHRPKQTAEAGEVRRRAARRARLAAAATRRSRPCTSTAARYASIAARSGSFADDAAVSRTRAARRMRVGRAAAARRRTRSRR